MAHAIFWGSLLRLSQAALQAAPFILTGLFVAGVFQRLLGSSGIGRLFGGRGVSGLFKGWLAGMLLPVCSLGVLPIARTMRRAGVSGGTVLAFVLTAPLFNPLSLLYGLTLSQPHVIFAFAFCSLAVVIAAGWLWDQWFPNSSQPEPSPPSVPHGIKRLTSIGVAGAREITGTSAGYMLIGLLGVWLLAVVLPPGSLQGSMNGDNLFAPLLMTVVAIPAYATPMLAMSQIGSMFQHGNSVGAAFVLLALGAGLNIGTILWMVRDYGWRRGVAWIGMLTVVVLLLSYGVDRPLAPKDIEPADHSHAFDVYCRPFPAADTGLAERTWYKLRSEVQLYEVLSAIVVAVLFATGLMLKLFDRRWRIESWLERAVVGRSRRWYDIVVPAPVLGGVALIGLIAFSIVGCFAYYPPPKESLEQLSLANVEALSAALSGNHEHAAHWIPICEEWNRKLQVGVYLRHGHLSEYHRMKARIFADKLESLEHEIKDGDQPEVRRLVASISHSFSRLRTAYTEEL